jgi:mannose-1-phosphate guanylyltransferase
MQALILAGGKGTRLRPLTVYTPKPIVPVVNRPFILYQLDVLRRAGITEITLSLSYQPDKIEHLLGDGSDYGVNIRFVTEPSPMGTGGAYRFGVASDAPTLVLNGDILTDLDISKVIAFHKKRKASATVALTPIANPEAYGLVETDQEHNVLRFLEKPRPEEIADLAINTINVGVYILEPEILGLIPRGENRSFEYDVFPEILRRRMKFVAFTLNGDYWRDIGTCQSYLEAHYDYLNGKISGFELEKTESSEIATAAAVDKRSILGPGCIIKPGAQVRNSVIGAGVTIEEKAIVENSVIWPHSRISTQAEVRAAIIGRGGHIGRNAVVGEGTVLGDKASLPDYSRV